MTEQEKKERQKKNDIRLIVGILVVAIAGFAAFRICASVFTREPEVVVTVDGKEYGRYPLQSKNAEKIKIELGGGAYNVLVIQDGKADIVEASCPDKICVNHAAIHLSGESIVCLPNKVVVTIENAEESGIDATTH